MFSFVNLWICHQNSLIPKVLSICPYTIAAVLAHIAYSLVYHHWNSANATIVISSSYQRWSKKAADWQCGNLSRYHCWEVYARTLASCLGHHLLRIWISQVDCKINSHLYLHRLVIVYYFIMHRDEGLSKLSIHSLSYYVISFSISLCLLRTLNFHKVFPIIFISFKVLT